jgi:hypothetical protein
VIGRYGSACGCGGPGRAEEALGRPWGIPGGYMQQLPPEGTAYEVPMASMSAPVEPLVPMLPPPQAVSVPDPPQTSITTALPRPPSSVVTASLPPPTAVSVPDKTFTAVAVTPQAVRQITTRGGLDGVGYGAPVNLGYGAPLGAIFKKDSALKCEEFRAKLAAAKRGEGTGIMGWFGGQGIFGNREQTLKRKIEKWCGKAMTEEQAFAQAESMYLQAVEAGDVSTQAAVEAALAEQQAADKQTQLYAAGGILIAALGLGGLLLATGGRRR